MRLHRFYIQNAHFETLTVSSAFVCTEESLVRQIHTVLRAKIGDAARFFNETGEIECAIEKIDKKEIGCKVSAKIEPLMQKKKVYLVQSLIKKDKFEWVAQKCTELGVTDIIPVISERSEKRGLDEERLQKIIIEATEQSGWGNVPTLHVILSLDEALAYLENKEVKIYMLDMIGSKKEKSDRRDEALCIGPEGGWGEGDKSIFTKRSVHTISLGTSTLRAETAAIVGVYECMR